MDGAIVERGSKAIDSYLCDFAIVTEGNNVVEDSFIGKRSVIEDSHVKGCFIHPLSWVENCTEENAELSGIYKDEELKNIRLKPLNESLDDLKQSENQK